MSSISRREALGRLAAAGAVVGGAAVATRVRWDAGGFDLARSEKERQVRDFRTHAPGPAPVMAIAKSSTDPGVLTRRAVDALGGMKRFVSNGDIVAIKPNIGWDRMPIHAANTNPLVVAELVKMAFEAGAKQVIVTDASCNEPNRCFQRSGIWRAAYALDATIILPVDKQAQTLLMPVAARRQLNDLPDELWTEVNIEFYKDASDAVFKALVE
jgi:hypothetical protein